VDVSIFGDFVKVRREELSLDQGGLALQLGVHQQTVSKWEQAKAVPPPKRIRELAEVLRVDVSDLMRYAGYLPDDKRAEVEAEEPFHRLMGQVSGLTNDQLIRPDRPGMGRVPEPSRLLPGGPAPHGGQASRLIVT
jgi:transcriptional regulator with XRE-family HTH domain